MKSWRVEGRASVYIIVVLVVVSFCLCRRHVSLLWFRMQKGSGFCMTKKWTEIGANALGTRR
jgi:hypothetical protein